MNLKKILFLFSVIFLISCNKKDEDYYISTANKFANDNKLKEAIVAYKNALQKNKDNLSVRLSLAKIYNKQNEILSAKKELDYVIKTKNDLKENFPLYLEIYFKAQEFQEIIDLDIKHLSKKDQNAAMLAQGKSYFALDKLTKAKDKFQKLIDTTNNQNYKKIAKAYIFLQEDKYKLALNSLKSIKQDDFLKAQILQGKLQMLLKQYTDAVLTYENLLKKVPNNNYFKEMWLEALIAAGDIKTVSEKIENLTEEDFLNYPNFYKQLAKINFLNKNCKLAKANANKVLNMQENNTSAKLILGFCNFQNNNKEQAYFYLSSIKHEINNNIQALKLLLQLEFELGYFENSEKTLELLTSNKNITANELNYLAANFIQNQDVDFAKEFLEKSLEVDQNNNTALLGLGILKLENNDRSGIKNLEAIHKTDKTNPRLNIVLYLDYLKNKDYKKAKQLLFDWIEKKPNDLDAQNLLAALYQKMDQKEKAHEIFLKTLKQDENNTVALKQLFLIDFANNDYKTAKTRLKKLIKKSPNHQGYLHLWLTLSTQTNDYQELKKHLNSNKEIEKSFKHYFLAKISYLEKDFKNAKIELNNSLKVKKNIPSLELLAVFEQGKPNRLKNIYLDILTIDKKSHKAYLKLFEIYLAQNKKSDYEKVLNQAKEEFEDDFNWQANFIHFQTKNNMLTAAKINLAKHEKNLKSINKYQENAGFLAYKEKDYLKAIEFLLPLEKNNNLLRDPHLALIFSFKNTRQNEKAKLSLDTYLAKNPKDIFALFLKAKLQKDKKNQINTYLEILKLEPQNDLALNNLAWLFYLNKDLTKAKNHAQKAYKINPKSQQIRRTFATISFAKNNYKLVNKIYSEQKVKDLNSQDVILYAKSLDQTKENQKAQKILEEFLLNKKNDEVLNLYNQIKNNEN